jgi:hypothetical protein
LAQELNMRRLPLIFAVALAAVTTAARADVYKVVDAQGHVEYTDRWEPGAERIKSDHLHGTDPPPDTDDQKKLAAANDHVAAEQAQQAAAKAVSQDEATAHAAQCKSATEAYQKLIEARRVFSTSKDGERQYLSDDDADKQRVQARLNMEMLCGKTSASATAGLSQSQNP